MIPVKVNPSFTGGERKMIKLNIQTAELALNWKRQNQSGSMGRPFPVCSIRFVASMSKKHRITL